MHFNMFAKSGWLPPPTLSPRKSQPFKPCFVLLEDEKMIKPFSKPWCFQASKWKILRVKVLVWHPPKNGFYIGDCFKKIWCISLREAAKYDHLAPSHNHGSGNLPYCKGKSSWRNPFSTSMIMEEEKSYVCSSRVFVELMSSMCGLKTAGTNPFTNNSKDHSGN